MNQDNLMSIDTQDHQSATVQQPADGTYTHDAADTVGSRTISKPDNNDNGKLGWFTILRFHVVSTFLYGVYRLFGLTGLYQFGQFFGLLEYILQYNRRARFTARVRQMFGNQLSRKDIRQAMRRQFRRIRCEKMLYTILDRVDREELLERVDTGNIEEFEQCRARDKGTLILFSHHGAHHLGGIFLVMLGHQLRGIRDPKESVLRRYVQERFEMTLPEFRNLDIAFSGDIVRPFYRVFRQGGLAAAAVDVDRNRGNWRTVPVRIFGGEQQFLSGMVQIAIRSQASIVTGFLISEKHYRFRMQFHPYPIAPEELTDDDDTIGSVLQWYADLVEQHVRRYPCHVSKTK